MFSHKTPLAIEKVKQLILKPEGLAWTDLLVLCALLDLRERFPMATSRQVIDVLKLDRCWVYRSIGKLEKKGFITRLRRPKGADLLSANGWAQVLLNMANDCFEGRDLALVGGATIATLRAL